jgi:hypothetical protein
VKVLTRKDARLSMMTNAENRPNIQNEVGTLQSLSKGNASVDPFLGTE